jgi:hypothetical protein
MAANSSNEDDEAKLENLAKRLLSMPPKRRDETKAPHKPQAELKAGKTRRAVVAKGIVKKPKAKPAK